MKIVIERIIDSFIGAINVSGKSYYLNLMQVSYMDIQSKAIYSAGGYENLSQDF